MSTKWLAHKGQPIQFGNLHHSSTWTAISKHTFTFYYKRSMKSALEILYVFHTNHFYRAMLCGTSHGPVSVCLSICLSVTSRCSTKTAKCRITQTTPHDSPGTLVFRSQRSPRNSTGVTPYEGAECRWGGSKWRLLTNNRLYLENGTR